MVKLSKNIGQDRQAGVTLFLALLILSSVMAISFSLATIIFVEIKASGDIIKSEPAFFAAESVSEIGVFNVKRSVPSASSTVPSTVGTAEISSFVQNPLAPPVQQVQILPSSNTFSSTLSRFILFNSSATSCTDQSRPCGGYGRIKVTYLTTTNTDPLYIYLCEYDPTNTTHDCDHVPSSCPSGNICNFLVNGLPLYRGQVWDSYTYLSNTALNSNRQYELRLVNSNLTSSQSIYVQLESFDADGNTRKGLPYLNQKGIEVNTTNGGTTRSIRTVVPTQ